MHSLREKKNQKSSNARSRRVSRLFVLRNKSNEFQRNDKVIIRYVIIPQPSSTLTSRCVRIARFIVRVILGFSIAPRVHAGSL